MEYYLNTTTAQPNPTPLKPVGLPDSFNCEWVSQEDANSNSGLAAVRRVLGEGAETLNSLNTLRAKPNPLETVARNHANIENLVNQATGKLSRNHDEAMRALTNAESELTAKVATAANLKPDPYAAEIRASFKAMKLQDRQAALSQAVEDQNRQVLSAVMDAPEIVTGIPAQHTIALREKFNRDVAPFEMAQLDKLKDASKHLTKYFGDIYSTVPKFYAGLQTAKGKEANELAARLAEAFSEKAA